MDAAEIRWEPCSWWTVDGSSQVGYHQVVIIAQDQYGNSNTQSFIISVTPGIARATVTSNPDRLKVYLGHSNVLRHNITFFTSSLSTANISFSQTVAPENAGISITSNTQPGWTSNVPNAWLYDQTITGNTAGEYTITTTVTVEETGRSDEYIVVVIVVDNNQVPQTSLRRLTIHPGTFRTGETTDVRFHTRINNLSEVPSSVVLEEVDSQGNYVATIGELYDNGTSGDEEPNDGVYTGIVTISRSVTQNIYFIGRAIFSSSDIQTEIGLLKGTDFPVGSAEGDESKLVEFADDGAMLYSNRIILSFVEGTSVDLINNIVDEIGGTVVGTILDLGYYQVEFQDNGTPDDVKMRINYVKEYYGAEVESAAPEVVLFPESNGDNSARDEQWGLKKIGADDAWLFARANGSTKVAIVDSGLHLDDEIHYPTHTPHEDLIGMIDCKNAKSFFDNIDVRDNHGHGTRISGTLAGNGAKLDNNDAIAGVCWDCRIVPLKVCRAISIYPYRKCDLSMTIDAIKYASSLENVKVINISLGIPLPDPRWTREIENSIRDAISNAISNGKIVVMSAGNQSGIDKNAFANAVVGFSSGDYILGGFVVGATTENDLKTKLSNWGSNVNISAPGEDIYTTVGTIDHDFRQGTSHSAALVSGAAAVLYPYMEEAYTDTTSQDVVYRLWKTATKLPVAEQIGRGRLDVYEAVFGGGFELNSVKSLLWPIDPDPLPNSGWNTEGFDRMLHFIIGEGASIPRLHKIHPKNGQFMGYVSNGRKGDETLWGTYLWQTLKFKPGYKSVSISLEYMFITEEQQIQGDYHRNDGPDPDWFEIYLTTENADVFHTIERQSVESLNAYLVDTMDNFRLSEDVAVRATKWRKPQEKIIEIPEEGGTYHLAILITDASDAYYDSVLLIDNVRVVGIK